MKLLFILLFINIQVFAVDLLTDYRVNGISKIEKRMDSELTKQDYWDKFLADKDTTFGFIESYTNILTCNKNSSTLSLYSKDENNTNK